jgi:prolyl oligopeptidase
VTHGKQNGAAMKTILVLLVLTFGTVCGGAKAGGYHLVYSLYPADNSANGGLAVIGTTLYGTTITEEGSYCNTPERCGTIFSVTPRGIGSQLYEFASGDAGSAPQSGLLKVRDLLLGTTYQGGSGGCQFYGYTIGCGTVFSVTPGGTPPLRPSPGSVRWRRDKSLLLLFFRKEDLSSLALPSVITASKRYPWSAKMKSAVFLIFLAAAAPLANPPVTAPPAIAFHETVFGVSINDPYRWMEDPAKQAAMTDWVKASSAATVADLAKVPERPALARLVEQAARAGVRFSDVTSAGAKLFYRRQDAADRTAKLVVREAGQERVLLDPQAGHAAVSAIGNYSVAPDGRTVAVQVSTGGGEVGEIRFVDVATGQTKGHALAPVWGELQAVWLGPGHIAYTRMADPGTAADPVQQQRVAVLATGAPGPGRFVLGAGVAGAPAFDPAEFPLVQSSPVSPYVLGLGAGARSDSRIFLARAAELAGGKPAWRPIAAYADEVTGATLLGDTLFLLTTKDTPNGKILKRGAAPSASPVAETVLPEGKLVLNGIEAARDGLYVSAERDGISHLLFLPGGRGPAREVVLPFDGNLSDLRADLDGGSVLFGLNGWTTSTTYYRARAGQVTAVGLASDVWPGAAGVSVRRDEAVSADGTHVPMVTLVPSGSKAGALPTILEGYGGYGTDTISPWYSPPFLAWVAHGGAFAFCGTRGGGERGRIWHEAGRAGNKPNAQADFVACAARLESTGMTSKSMLVATGTSAGGTLVPSAVLQRPDLFAGLISRVAMVNATRLAVSENGANQFAEMGDPGTPEGFAGLVREDGYLALETAKDMPDTLVTVGLNDRRVSPWHGAKFAARARAKFGAHRLVLIRADAEAGHGIGSARDRLIAEWADTFAFAWSVTHRT